MSQHEERWGGPPHLVSDDVQRRVDEIAQEAVLDVLSKIRIDPTLCTSGLPVHVRELGVVKYMVQRLMEVAIKRGVERRVARKLFLEFIDEELAHR